MPTTLIKAKTINVDKEQRGFHTIIKTSMLSTIYGDELESLMEMLQKKLDALQTLIEANTDLINDCQDKCEEYRQSLLDLIQKVRDELSGAIAEYEKKINVKITNINDVLDARATLLERLSTNFEDLYANFQREIEVRIHKDNELEQAQALLTTTLNVGIDTLKSQYAHKIDLLTTKTDKLQESQGRLEESLESRVSDAVSTYTSEITTRVTKTEKDITAQAQSLSSISTTVGNNTVNISRQATIVTRLDNDNKNQAKWNAEVKDMITNPQGNQTGLQFGDSSYNGSGDKSFFNIFANTIKLVSGGVPIIEVNNGQAILTDAVKRRGKFVYRLHTGLFVPQGTTLPAGSSAHIEAEIVPSGNSYFPWRYQFTQQNRNVEWYSSEGGMEWGKAKSALMFTFYHERTLNGDWRGRTFWGMGYEFLDGMVRQNMISTDRSVKSFEMWGLAL